jgi:hypothetical protein
MAASVLLPFSSLNYYNKESLQKKFCVSLEVPEHLELGAGHLVTTGRLPVVRQLVMEQLDENTSHDLLRLALLQAFIRLFWKDLPRHQAMDGLTSNIRFVIPASRVFF